MGALVGAIYHYSIIGPYVGPVMPMSFHGHHHSMKTVASQANPALMSALISGAASGAIGAWAVGEMAAMSPIVAGIVGGIGGVMVFDKFLVQ